MSDQRDRNERESDETEPLRPPAGEPGRISTTSSGSPEAADLSLDGGFGFDNIDTDAVDLSLVHADDAFLDRLGVAEQDLTDEFADDELAALLLSWRREVDGSPIRELVDPKLAVATVQAARARKRRRPRLLAPVAAAAAVLAIAFAGMGLAARDAQPGDTLWGLTRVLYADHARSVEAAAAVRTNLAGAQAALAAGKVAEAKFRLDEAKNGLPAVMSEDGQADLEAEHAALEAQLPDKPADGASPPPSANPTTVPDTGSTTSPVDTTQSSSPPSDTTTTPTTPTTTSQTQSEPGRIEETPPASDPAGEPAGGDPGTSPAEVGEAPAAETP